jgi:uncharacterized membrane protein YjfL (UPF0719 family)
MKIQKTLLYAASILWAASAIAQPETQSAESWHARTVGQALGYSALFGLMGIVMVLIGCKIFDKTVTRINLEQEILKGNIAAAILSGSAIIAIGLIIAASIG